MNAPDPPLPLVSTAPSHAERLFPTLTSTQIARIATLGRRRPIARGEVLVEVGDNDVPFFVVVSGEVQACGQREPRRSSLWRTDRASSQAKPS